MDLPEMIMALNKVQDRLKTAIRKRYFNTQPVITTSNKVNEKIYDIPFLLEDVLLVGAITQSPVLLSGSSGSGKTYLAELMLEFLFTKDGYTRKNITPDMNEQDFMDIDFGAIKEGKMLKEAMTADKLFNRPSLIIDEANRAPPIIQNRLMQILENNIDLKSKSYKAGKLLENGAHYQWVLLTLNLGSEYAGTAAVDRALKDRITIDIPIDNFPPKLDDQIKMIRAKHRAQPMDENEDVDTDEVIYSVYQALDKIPLSLDAEALLLYLSFCSNCVKSPTGSKYGIIFSPNYCKEQGCEYARNPPLNEFCPYMFAPSNRVLRKAVHVAKGFFLLKQAKLLDILLSKGDENIDKCLSILESNKEVGIDDIIKISPLVLHSKIPLNREHVITKFNGNTYLATSHILKVIQGRLNDFIRHILPGLLKEKRKEELSEKDKTLRKRLVGEDFHYDGLIKYVKKYLDY